MSNFSGLSVLVSNLYGLGSYLDLTVSNNSGDGTVLSDGWSSMYLFLDSYWSWDNRGSDDTSGESGVSCWGKSSQQGTSWGSGGQSQTGRQNLKNNNCENTTFLLFCDNWNKHVAIISYDSI